MQENEGKLVEITKKRVEITRKNGFDINLFIEQVLDYVKRNGSYKNITVDPVVGKRVRRVREAYKSKRHVIKLTPEMIDALNAIGFEWEARSEDWFEPFYEKLVEYKQIYGSFKSVTQDLEIGAQVCSIRQSYKKKGNRNLSAERIARLDAIGFPWEAESRGWFEPFLKKLIEFKEEHGSFSGVTVDPEIGIKVRSVRNAYQGIGSTRLTPEMIDALNKIGFPWIVIERGAWQKQLIEDLKQYKQEHGSFYGITQDNKLGAKVIKVRAAYFGRIDYKLSPDFIEELNAIGFSWKANQKDWFMPFFEKLKEYKLKHGSFKGVATDPEIGYTVGSVRQAYKGNRNQKLTEEMINKLNEIGFPFDAGYGKLVAKTADRVVENMSMFNFELFYEELLKYKKSFGNLCVSYGYESKIVDENGNYTSYPLGIRVSSIRMSAKKIKEGKTPRSYILTEEQYARLNEIGFVWRGRANAFDLFYSELKVYKEKFGNLNIPVLYFNEETKYSLGAIANAVRHSKRALENGEEAKVYLFTDEQYKMLEDLGFSWQKLHKSRTKTCEM